MTSLRLSTSLLTARIYVATKPWSSMDASIGATAEVGCSFVAKRRASFSSLNTASSYINP
jgi:hypothetical protein